MGKVLLALDVATTTGFAFGEVGGTPRASAIRFGRPARKSIDDPGSCDDDIWVAALKWLHDLIKVVQPDIIALEAPIMSSNLGGNTNARTMMRLIGLQAVLRAVVCVHKTSPARLIHVQSARKLFIGKGNLPGEQAKRLVKARCIELGWLTEENATFDKADACCVWAKACSDIEPEIALQFSPLFRKSAAGQVVI